MKIPHFLFVFFKWEEKTKQSFLKEKENDVLMVSAGHAPDEIRWIPLAASGMALELMSPTTVYMVRLSSFPLTSPDIYMPLVYKYI